MSEIGFIQPTGLSGLNTSENQKQGRVPENKGGGTLGLEPGSTVVGSKGVASSKETGVKSSPGELRAQMDRVNSQLESQQSYLKFELDENTDKMVFFIKNTETDEVLRQVPSEEFLEISKNITDFLENSRSAVGRDSFPVGTLASKTV